MGAPSQRVRPDENVQRGGTCSGNPQYSATAPRTYPTSAINVRVDALDRMSRLLAPSVAALGRATRTAAARPGPVNQMLDEVLEDRRVQLVPNLLPAAFGRDETGVLQDGEVPRDGGPAGIKAGRDVARRE